MVNAVVVLETARRAVRAIVASAEERRLHHGTFLAPVTQEKHRRAALNQTLGYRHACVFLERPVRRVRDKGRIAAGVRARENIEIRCSLAVHRVRAAPPLWILLNDVSLDIDKRRGRDDVGPCTRVPVDPDMKLIKPLVKIYELSWETSALRKRFMLGFAALRAVLAERSWRRVVTNCRVFACEWRTVRRCRRKMELRCD